jgi:K+ transporter
VYHFYFGDEFGTPGTIMTTFPYGKGLANGRHGKGMLNTTAFSISMEAFDYWMERLDKFNIPYKQAQQRFSGEVFIYLEDFDGLGLELVFFSSVLWGITDGSWIILVFAAIMFFIMFVWNYGSKLKYEAEVKQRLSPDLMRDLGCNLGTIRAPGIGLLYNELVKGIPGILGHFLTTLPAIHSMIILVSIKYVPVAMVPQSERFLFRRVCQRSYHLFRCIAR